MGWWSPPLARAVEWEAARAGRWRQEKGQQTYCWDAAEAGKGGKASDDRRGGRELSSARTARYALSPQRHLSPGAAQVTQPHTLTRASARSAETAKQEYRVGCQDAG